MIGQIHYNLIFTVFGAACDKEKQSSKSRFLQQQPFDLSLMSGIIKPQRSIKTGATLAFRHSPEKPTSPELGREAFARLALDERQPLGEFERVRTNDIMAQSKQKSTAPFGAAESISSPEKATPFVLRLLDSPFEI
tara:strand:+ start:457 stop:864 length:408 start_codon:yes stop_codon:yes gene_type:complete